MKSKDAKANQFANVNRSSICVNATDATIQPSGAGTPLVNPATVIFLNLTTFMAIVIGGLMSLMHGIYSTRKLLSSEVWHDLQKNSLVRGNGQGSRGAFTTGQNAIKV